METIKIINIQDYAKWIEDPNVDYEYWCSYCGTVAEDKTKHCPYCGKKMLNWRDKWNQ